MMKSSKLRQVVIIAEAGVNHNGDLNRAKALIDVAVEAGADYVKFQTFKADRLVSSASKKASYQQRNFSDGDNSQLKMLRELELDRTAHLQLIDYAKQKGIGFLSTPFDLESADLLKELGISQFKIPSGELTNLPMIEKIASFGKPIILSTGMATMDEIEDALNAFLDNGIGRHDITILHCNTEYPTPMGDVNLRAMGSIADRFHVDVGYSDHTLGIEVPIAAVALGATIIEKHFTLDRGLPGPDHKASLEPEELKNMVTAIRNITEALGSATKEPSASEEANIVVARKSIHLAVDKKSGQLLEAQDLLMLRPGDGISPMKYKSLLGKGVSRDLPGGHKLDWKDLN